MWPYLRIYRACQIDPIVIAMHALRANCYEYDDGCVSYRMFDVESKHATYVPGMMGMIYTRYAGERGGGAGRWGRLEVTQEVGVSNCNSNLRVCWRQHKLVPWRQTHYKSGRKNKK